MEVIMKKRVMDSIRKKLLWKMNDILDMFEKEELEEIGEVESENVIGDIVDKANTVYEMQINEKLNETERVKLLEIQEALKRIEEGVYGRCVVCGKQIEEKRLLAIPEAKMCIQCKAAAERKKF